MLDIKKSTVIILAVFFLLLDRFFKTLALIFHPNTILFGHIFRFNFVPNPYIAFSLPFSGVFLNLLILILIFWLFSQLIVSFKKNLFINNLGFLLIILGAASNLYDRLRLGYVIDYFDLKYFTIFNLADSMIFMGVMTLLIFNTKQEN